MSLEAALEANTAALTELTKAILGNGPKISGTGGTSAATTTKTSKPKSSLADVTKAAVTVKEKLGEAKAKELIRDVGKSDSLKAVAPENFDALLEACNAAIKAADEDGGL